MDDEEDKSDSDFSDAFTVKGETDSFEELNEDIILAIGDAEVLESPPLFEATALANRIATID